MDNNLLSADIFDTFEIDSAYMPASTAEDTFLKELHTILKRRIEELMDKNPERLMWILYRIDVNEQKVKQALAENDSRDYSDVIASLIIARQLQKIKTRYAGTSADSGWSFDV